MADTPDMGDEFSFGADPGSILEPGSIVDGRYRVDRLLGRGGMGIVYLAYDERFLPRRVVLKLLLDTADPWQYRKFEEECAALARVTHPGVAKPLDRGKLPTGRPYLVMEYVEGQDFGSVMRTLDLSVLSEVLFRAGDAVSSVRGEGVLHRDLTPKNIIFQVLSSGEPRVVILDFGIASLRDSPASQPPLTLVVGTLGYWDGAEPGMRRHGRRRNEPWSAGSPVPGLGYVDKAEKHFERDLDLASQLGS